MERQGSGKLRFGEVVATKRLADSIGVFLKRPDINAQAMFKALRLADIARHVMAGRTG
jgi:hypothetical protein